MNVSSQQKCCPHILLKEEPKNLIEEVPEKWYAQANIQNKATRKILKAIQ